MQTDQPTSSLRPLASDRQGDFFEEYRRAMDRVMRDFVDGVPGRPFGRAESAESFMPKLDFKEEPQQIVVSAELPGLSEKDVEVTVENGVLTIKGEKKDEKEETSKGRYYSERHYGSFERSMKLPAKTDQEKITAAIEKGILRVVIPKTADAGKDVKRISIKH